MLDIIIITVMAFYLGWRIREALMLLTFREILRDLGVPEDRLRRLALTKGIDLTDPQPEQDSAPDKTIEIRVEQHQGCLYAYRMDNDEFLGQGQDRELLVQRIAETYKNTRFIIRDSQGADLLKT